MKIKTNFQQKIEVRKGAIFRLKTVCACYTRVVYIITINVPLILKMGEIIFFLQANYFMGHFEQYFEGAKTFLTL
jgi:hypothetical protein